MTRLCSKTFEQDGRKRRCCLRVDYNGAHSGAPCRSRTDEKDGKHVCHECGRLIRHVACHAYTPTGDVKPMCSGCFYDRPLHLPGTRSSGEKRDSQRSALYAWERRLFVHGEKMTLDECKALVRRVWEAYVNPTCSKPVPNVRAGADRHSAHAWGCVEIKLPKWARNPQVVLHEVAHAAINAFDATQTAPKEKRWRVQSHGPEFVLVFVELLVAFAGEDRARLLAELTKGKRQVRIASTLPWKKAPVKAPVTTKRPKLSDEKRESERLRVAAWRERKRLAALQLAGASNSA